MNDNVEDLINNIKKIDLNKNNDYQLILMKL